MTALSAVAAAQPRNVLSSMVEKGTGLNIERFTKAIAGDQMTGNTTVLCDRQCKLFDVG